MLRTKLQVLFAILLPFFAELRSFYTQVVSPTHCFAYKSFRPQATVASVDTREHSRMLFVNSHLEIFNILPFFIMFYWFSSRHLYHELLLSYNNVVTPPLQSSLEGISGGMFLPELPTEEASGPSCGLFHALFRVLTAVIKNIVSCENLVAQGLSNLCDSVEN